jgi:outer membrane protein assembly factor BamB
MSDGSSRSLKPIGWIVAIAFAIQLIVFERGVLNGTRFGGSPGKTLVAGFAGLLVFGAAAAVSAGLWRPRRRTMGAFIVAFAALATVRFHLPELILRRQRSYLVQEYKKFLIPDRIATDQAPELVRFLRELPAAQEQYRLRRGVYTTSIDSLTEWVRYPQGSTVRLAANSDIGWSGTASLNGATCSIWVRDSSLRVKERQPEGHASCGSPELRKVYEQVGTVAVRGQPAARPFVDADISGTWLQHRADPTRTGVSSDARNAGAFRWDASVGGSIRSSVSIAGNQVFVGTHGNGELVALTLDSGKVGFRIRTPNWIHHEPAITSDLLIVGFGNNEEGHGHTVIGTAPSGVAAYDRRTGAERWRRYTDGSVMTVPVVGDSIVATATAGQLAVGMRLGDGAELWRSTVPGMTPMGNPLLLGNTMMYGVEKLNVCAIDIRDGRVNYCRRLSGGGWGAGHASPAVSGDVAIQVAADAQTFEHDRLVRGTPEFYLRKILGVPLTRGAHASEAWVFGLDVQTGRERWRTRLGRGRIVPPGHIAGTPVIIEGIAYLPSVYNGHVVALNASSGQILWSVPVRVTRGSVTVARGLVFAATVDTGFVVLQRSTGKVACRQRLPAPSDRAGLTISGNTAVLTLRNGTVMARPVGDWLACKA